MWEADFRGNAQEIHLSTLQTDITEPLQDVMGTGTGFRRKKEFVCGKLTGPLRRNIVVGTLISCMP